MFAHGFGCDQNMWRFVAPAFATTHRIGAVRSHGRRPLGPRRLRLHEVRLPRRLRRRRPGDLCRARADRRRVRRPLGERDGRGARRGPCTRPVRGAGPHRSVAALSRRHGLHGRLLARRRRRPSGLVGEQLPRLVERDCPGDHGQPGAPGARPGADQQLLPYRSGDRPPVRAGHLPVRQPGRPRAGARPDPGPAVQRRHHRAGAGGPVRARAHPRQHASCSCRHAVTAPTCPRRPRPIVAIQGFLPAGATATR